MKNVIVSIENRKEIIETIESVVAEIKNNNAAELEELIKKKTFREKLSKAISGNKNGQKMILKDITDIGCLLQLLTSLSQHVYIENHQLMEELFACTVVLNNRFSELKADVQNLKEELIKLKTKRDLNVYNIEMLNADEKMILICIINTIFADAEKTDALRAYHRCVRVFVGCGNDLSERIQNPEEDMEAIQHAELFYRFILESIAFVDSELSETTLAKIEEITDQLTMKRSKQKEILQDVLNDIKDLGVEYFCYKYENATNDSLELFYLDDSFFEEDQDDSILGLDLQKIEDADFIDEAVRALEEESVLTILTIQKGETKIFKNKSLHINAFVNCSGTLQIENCTLYYNENDFCDEITLNEGAELIIKNSHVICSGFDEKFFIKSERAKKITITNTIFDDCSYFITGAIEEFLLHQSKVKNCFKGFLDFYADKCKISNNLFLNTFLKNEDCFADSYLPCVNVKAITTEETSYFVNNVVEFSSDFAKNTKNLYLVLKGGIIEKCTFIGMNKPIDSKTIKDSRFISCEKLLYGVYPVNKQIGIINCYFEKCTEISLSRDNVCFENCCFVSCFNELISSSYDGNIKVLSCHFINLYSIPVKNDAMDFVSVPECIFRFDVIKNIEKSCMINCIFDGVDLKKTKTYLIQLKGYESCKKTVLEIENCEVRNCSSISEKIINNEYYFYPTKFSKTQKAEYAKVSQYNCRGFDTISKDRIPVDEDKINAIREQYANLGADLQIDE